MTGQEKKTLIRGFRHKLNELHRRGDISDNQFDIFNNLLQVHHKFWGLNPQGIQHPQQHQ